MTAPIVIKFGGAVLDRGSVLTPLIQAISRLQNQGEAIVCVHGGGAQADRLHDRLDVPIRKIQGRRITDQDTLEIAQMVYGGQVNLNLVSHFLRHNVNAVGITGVDGLLVQVHRRPPREMKDPDSGESETVDFEFVGDVEHIDTSVLESLLEDQFLPVIGCLGADREGQIYNVNADTVSARIAAAMNASQLVYVTSVKGVLEEQSDDDAEPIPHLTEDQAQEMIADGTITEGMIPKVDTALEALQDGVGRVFITGELETEDQWMEAISHTHHGTTIEKETT